MKPMSKSSLPVKVVCVGGGYVAIYLARALGRALRSGRVTLTVIDRNNFHCFHGLVPEMLAGKLQPGNVLSSARRLFRDARFQCAEIERVDLDAKEVTISRELDGREFTIPYDHLVLAAGSKEDLSRFPGIAEHTLRLKSFQDILMVRHHLIAMLELADIETDPVEQERLLSFVVAGGNYAGVEVASELMAFLPATARRNYPNIPIGKIRIRLLHSGDHILPELGTHFPKLQAYAEKALRDPHLEVITGIRLASATSEEAVLNDGRRISTRTIISCTGSKVAPVLDPLPFPKDRGGRLMTDAFLRVPEADNLWAGGDCAAVPHPKGGTCPPLAIWAMTAGAQIGKNILRTLDGEPLRPYRFTGLGDACTLGRHRAVAHLKGITLRGFPAYLVWRLFMILYLPAWEKKARVIFDWTVGAVFGRDLVNMNVHQQVAVSPVMFEPGQDIVREGDIGQSLFIIKSGTVEVFKHLPEGGEEKVAELTSGAHFGEVAVFQRDRRTATCRAATRVELLHVRRETAVALSDSFSPVGNALRASPASSSISVPDNIPT